MTLGAPEAPAQESMWEPYIWLPLAFQKKAVGSFWMFQAAVLCSELGWLLLTKTEPRTSVVVMCSELLKEKIRL